MFVVRDFEEKDFRFENFVFPETWQFGMYRHRFPEHSEAVPSSEVIYSEKFHRPCLCVCVGLFFGSPVIIGDARIVSLEELQIMAETLQDTLLKESENTLFLMVTIASLTRKGVRFTKEFLEQSRPILANRASNAGFGNVVILGEIEKGHERSLGYAKRQGFKFLGLWRGREMVAMKLETKTEGQN